MQVTDGRLIIKFGRRREFPSIAAIVVKSQNHSRKELIRHVAEVYRHLLATVSNSGELGTVTNWEQHILPELLIKPGEMLAQLLGEPLPVDAQPAKHYRGPTRVIVPTLCTSLSAGEALKKA